MDVEQLLVSEFLSDHPEDSARVLEQMPLEQAVAVLSAAPAAAAGRSLGGLTTQFAARCLESVESAKGAALIEVLPPGAAANLLRRIKPQKRLAVLAGVENKKREHLELLLQYSDDMAGAIMDPLIATVPGDITVAEALRRLRQMEAQLYDYVYVVNRGQKLAGVVGLRQLLLAGEGEQVRSVMNPKAMSVSDRAPLAAVVTHPAWREFHALPVVSDDGGFVGIIRYKTLRRISEEAEAGRGPAGLETLFALGELYWTGMVELFGGMSTATRPRGNPDV